WMVGGKAAFRVQGSGFRVQGSGFRVQGFRKNIRIKDEKSHSVTLSYHFGIRGQGNTMLSVPSWFLFDLFPKFETLNPEP
ncbi:MAG TPA: hypothetical protein PLL06_11755, partial [Acidobacteriota bacterium]|nr:hypothetical protein [Acidobacteriota bacterium]